MKYTIRKCSECGSDFYYEVSPMEGLCTNCSSALYDYDNCEHQFEEGRCVKCYWDGSVSEYIKSLNYVNPKSQEINDLVFYGLDLIDEKRKVEVSVRDIMCLYKSVEEFRRFFHKKSHYPLLSDLDDFIGDCNRGGYSVLEYLYSKVLDKYIPQDIEDTLGDETDFLTKPGYPFYYNLKKEEKSKLSSTEESHKEAISFLEENDVEVEKVGEKWKGEHYNFSIEADSPLELLGLYTLYKNK